MENNEQSISWHKFSVSRAESIDCKMNVIMTEFMDLFILMTAPGTVSLFCLRKPSADPMDYFVSIGELRDIHKIAIYGFLKKYNAIPCDRPKENDVALLVGSQNAWGFLKD